MVSTKNLGLAIADRRKKASLTQDELSDKAGLSYSTLAKIEQGSIKAPSVFTIQGIAAALNVQIDELLENSAKSPTLSVKSIVKFVYCDVNDVLVQSNQQAFVNVAEKNEIPLDKFEEAFWYYNDPTNRGEMSVDDFNKAVARMVGIKELDWAKEYLEAVEQVKPMHDYLCQLQSKYKVGLLTDAQPEMTMNMIALGILPQIDYDAIVDSSELGFKKPQDEIYQEAEKKAGVRGAEILFIDNNRTNLVAAEHFGWRTLWFDDYRPKESIQRLQKALNE